MEKVDDPEGLDVCADVVGLVVPVDPGLADADDVALVFAEDDGVVLEGFAELVAVPVAPVEAFLVAEDAEADPAFTPAEGVDDELPGFEVADGALPGFGSPGFAAVGFVSAGFVSAGFLSDDAELPDFGTLDEELPVAVLADGVLPGLSATFSAFRSIVTGRLDPAAVDGLSLLPGLSEEPEPVPPEEDVPPEDFLSVAICSPPEPILSGFFHSLYTPLGEAVPPRSSLLRAAKQRLHLIWLTLS